MDGDVSIAVKTSAPMAGEPMQDYRQVLKHGIMPRTSHDDAERFNFLYHLNRHVRGPVMAACRNAYENRVEPAFEKEKGRKPKNRHEARKAMLTEPMFQFYSSLRRASMEQRQQAGRWVALSQAEELRERAAAYADDDALQLNPALTTPRYVTEVDHHCMPGSYYTEYMEDDVVNGANYDVGFFSSFGGAPTMSGPGEGMVAWLKAYRPDFKPKRILDIGSTVGHNLAPMAMAFPDAEVVAVDVGAPVLRYHLARARSMGINNIRCVQADGADLSMFEDESFDIIQSCLLLHEISYPAMRAIFKETYRLAAPGALVYHADVGGYSDEQSLFEKAMRDWDAFYNNEPFMSTLKDIDVFDFFADAGFKEDEFFHASPLGYGPGKAQMGEGRLPPKLAALPGLNLFGSRK
ncbi:class I SAM-dependent methyltransferase [Phenylobacterium immobile]|uniref:class I SAM-dependent methyltransferase n=1 Tax=Phenylobacterium immobile TaxID=21 RepID=UPI000ABEE346|nr:class I SAM-dependent methyltransferase [Phenylobacterium immobile]